MDKNGKNPYLYTKFRELLKSGKVIISLVMIAVPIYLVIWSVSNYQNHQEEFDEERNTILKGLDDASMNVLNGCSDYVNIGNLEVCKNESIPKLIEMCNDAQYSNLSVCSDVRLKEFSNTVDQKIEFATTRIKNAANELDVAQLKQIEYCYPANTPIKLANCKLSIKSLVDFCSSNNLESSTCNDTRINEILNREPIVFSENIIEMATQDISAFLDECNYYTNESLVENCIETAKLMWDECVFAIKYGGANPVCFDPRLEELASKNLTHPSKIQNDFNANGGVTQKETESTVDTVENLYSSIYPQVQCIPSNDPMKFLAKVSLENTGNMQGIADFYVSSYWDNPSQNMRISYDVLSFEPITLNPGEKKIVEGLILRFTDNTKSKELSCEVFTN